MPQEPNINLDKIKRINDPVMPVPRKNSKRLAENLDPNDKEVFGSTGPDSGFAIKIVNKYKTLWGNHPRNKLVSSIVTNLMINRAAHFGRAPTVYDLHHILGILRITENSLGDLSEELLIKCSKEKNKGTHLLSIFNFY